MVLDITDVDENHHVIKNTVIPLSDSVMTDPSNSQNISVVADNTIDMPLLEAYNNTELDRVCGPAPRDVMLLVLDSAHADATKDNSNQENVIPETEDISKRNTKDSKRTRVRQPTTWKQNVRKIKRQHGEEYENVKGCKVPKKKASEKMCHSIEHCPFQCSRKISFQERQEINTSFWKLSDEKKLHFYSKHVKRHLPFRKRTEAENSKKSYSYSYFFVVSSVTLQVCQTYFLNTLNISKQRIYYFFKTNHNSSTEIPRTPLQGKHTKKVISGEKKEEVRTHIKSFPAVSSHYCRASTKKTYLERNLNMKRMYELYLSVTKEPVKFNIYETIFKTEFNISFFKPKKDICDKCAEHKMRKNPTQEDINIFNEHIHRKNLGNHERNTDRNRYLNNETVGVLTFDLQNTFSLPKSNISKNFYKMKLCCYNFTGHCNVNNTVYNAIWHEFMCGRAGVHIANALIRILKEVVKDNPNLEKLILWSDSCVPQNKNSIMSFALQWFLQTAHRGKLQIIEQKFGEPGHGNVQEIDNAHSCIERYLRNLEVWSPLTLIRLLLNIPTSWKLKFRVLQMQAKDYLDYQLVSSRYSYNAVPYTKVKHLIYEDSSLNIKYKTSFDGAVSNVKLRYTKRINLQKEVQLPESVPQVNTKSTAIPDQKKKHLLEMLPQMPEEEREFYASIIGKKKI